MSKDMSETEPKEHQLVSALTGASENGNANTVKLLLDKGVPVNSFDKYGMTALMRASQWGRMDIVRLLLDRGAQVDVIGASTAALLSRINRIAPGRKDLIKKLQGGGVFTALILASGSGHTEVVRLLLDRNALIDAVDFNGWTALISASSYGHVEVVGLLLEKGAQVNFQSSDRSGTALIAASEGGHLVVVKLLLENGADVNIYAKEGVTALMKATRHGHIDVVMLLLDKGAIVDFQQTQGETALMIACTLGHKNIVRALINHGADMYKDNGEGKSALTLAANRESDDIICVLLESDDRDTRSQATKKEENQSETESEFEDSEYANLSPTDDSSSNTQSCTGGDSRFSDSQVFLKESPYSSPQNTQWHERPEHSRTSLITSAAADEHTGYCKIPNPESRIEDITSMRESVATSDQPSGSKLKLGLTTSPKPLKGISRRHITADTDMKIHHTVKLSTLQSVYTYYECSNNIASVPFLSQVDILTCDSFGGQYYSSDHGIMLRIPAGAIPPGQIAHLEVAVALYGPFQFPDGSCPISPILWLCIQENIDLRKPIDIIFPHFLASVNENEIECLGISFAKADHMQHTTDVSGNKQYIFKSLEVPFIAYKEGNQNYGILSTQHCCFLCITSSNPITPDFALKAGYFLWCIEKPSSPYDILLFCTTFCLPTCRKALKLQYTEKDGYLIRNPKMFLFQHPEDGSEPCLSIMTHEDRVCLVAANPLNKQIKASKIHFWDEKNKNLSKSTIEQMHEEKTYPPGVELTLSMLESHPTKLPIRFDGSTANSSLDMEIMLPLASARNSHPVSTSSVTGFDHGSQWIATDKPELSTLFKELLRVSFKWENIGILLEIKAHCLESVKAVENTGNTQNCLREMLKIWLKMINPPPSWSAIIDALHHLGDEQLARDLRSKYLQ